MGKVYRGISYSTKDIERTLLSIVVSDSFVDKSIQAIIDSGATGEIGDGKIFLYNCEEAYRIRTGETGTKSFN
jgi:nitrogen regulatory protein P-II 1